jgi:hypothetical protein
MKTLPLLLTVIVFSVVILRSETPEDLAADLVLGAPDFSPAGYATSDACGIDYPLGVEIDPVSGKVFVLRTFRAVSSVLPMLVPSQMEMLPGW